MGRLNLKTVQYSEYSRTLLSQKGRVSRNTERKMKKQHKTGVRGREGGMKVKWSDIKRQRQDNSRAEAKRKERGVLQPGEYRAMKSGPGGHVEICIS